MAASLPHGCLARHPGLEEGPPGSTLRVCRQELARSIGLGVGGIGWSVPNSNTQLDGVLDPIKLNKKAIEIKSNRVEAFTVRSWLTPTLEINFILYQI